jgi:Outer membrane protein beta-barrel domain
VKPAVAFVALGIGLGAATTAHAAGADELQVAARVGIGVLNVGSDPWAPVVGLDVEYGLNDAWALRGSLEGYSHDVGADTTNGIPAGTQRLGAALAGVSYTIDILRLVPYADLELGVAHIGGPLSAPTTKLATELGIGGDYYVTRNLRAGVSFQYLYSPVDLISNPEQFGNSPFMFSATARISWVF